MVEIIDLNKLPNETEESYLWRIGQLVDSGQIESWKSINNIINEQLGFDEDSYRDESTFRKKYQTAKKFYENVFSKREPDDFQKELSIKLREIQKEKIKIQTEKLEYNRWLREEARDELIIEKIIEAIKSLTPLDIPEIIPVTHNKRSGALFFGDEHYGVEFALYGLFGEILNAYSPEIFEERMWELLNQVVEIIHREGFTKIYVFSMGDYQDGLLRVGQLFKLRYGNIEGTVKYADFICNWLNKLTNYVNVEFQMVHGNHSELRLLGQPKGTFKDENMGIIVYEMIKTRLANNPNFAIIKNPTGLIFANICGYNLLGIHGEVKNMENTLKDFSNTYKTQIDFLIAGHLHHSKSETVGIDRDVINVPSVIGVDDYSLSLNKISNAGATFVVFEEGKGKVMEYNIKLN